MLNLDLAVRYAADRVEAYSHRAADDGGWDYPTSLEARMLAREYVILTTWGQR
jgi:hypothetical protein